VSSTQKLGETADPPGAMFSDWESEELTTFHGSLPLTTEALLRVQPAVEPSNVPPETGA
jgi:hypothetical protein